MPQKLQDNIWKYTLILIANKRFFVAIFSIYYLTIPGVDAFGVGLIMLAGGLAGFIFEIPSGYWSDKFGHKNALVISRIFVLLSTTLFILATNLTHLILGGVALSIGQAFLSGTGSAFMHETLRGLKKENDYAKIMGKIGAIGFAVPIILMMAVPFLVTVSYKLPFAIALVTDFIGLLASIFLFTPPVPPEHVEEVGITNFKQVMREGYRLNFFMFALFSGLVSGILFGSSVFRAPYQQFLYIPVIYFGILYGIGRIGASLMIAYSGKIKAAMNIFSFYKFQLILYTILFLVLGLFPITWIIASVFIIMNAFQWGLSKAEDAYLIDIIRASKFKATLLSVNAQIDSMTGAFISFIMGIAIQKFSFANTFLYVGLGFITIMLPLYLTILHRRKKNNNLM
ncbi:MAG: MFS transporter [bacterium]|nr:MFS transporter [bacterium]